MLLLESFLTNMAINTSRAPWVPIDHFDALATVSLWSADVPPVVLGHGDLGIWLVLEG